jgi:hypothetical protein
MVELLFARGLVKVLFATETFAMVWRLKEFTDERVLICRPELLYFPEYENTMADLFVIFSLEK